MVRKGKVSRALGAHGEELVVRYLEREDYEILDRNWRCPHGELDVVALERATNTVVFVEVKTKSGPGFGAPLEAITHAKARRLYELARMWLQDRAMWAPSLRVDGIGVQFGAGEPVLTHLRGIAA